MNRGNGAKEFAATHGFPTESGDVEGVTLLVAQASGQGAVGSLNPDFTFKLTKYIVRGDAPCEWVVERKRR